MNSEFIFGIDPGKNGAIVVLNKGVYVDHMLNLCATTLYEAIQKYKPYQVFLEKAQTIPKQGIMSAFTYGCGFGEITGVLAVTNTSHIMFHPRIWQAKMFIGVPPHHAPKFKASTVFRRIFPKVVPLIANKSGKLHDGVVDAALIGYYGTKHL